MLHLLDEGSNHTVGHVGWHLLTTHWTLLDLAPAVVADNVTGGAAGYWQISGEAEAHRTLQGGLHYPRQLTGGCSSHLGK